MQMISMISNENERATDSVGDTAEETLAYLRRYEAD